MSCFSFPPTSPQPRRNLQSMHHTSQQWPRHTTVSQPLIFWLCRSRSFLLNWRQELLVLLQPKAELQYPIKDTEQACCFCCIISFRSICCRQICCLLFFWQLPTERNSNSCLDILLGQLTILLVTTSSCFFCEARRNILIKMTILRTRRRVTILDERDEL